MSFFRIQNILGFTALIIVFEISALASPGGAGTYKCTCDKPLKIKADLSDLDPEGYAVFRELPPAFYLPEVLTRLGEFSNVCNPGRTREDSFRGDYSTSENAIHKYSSRMAVRLYSECKTVPGVGSAWTIVQRTRSFGYDGVDRDLDGSALLVGTAVFYEDKYYLPDNTSETKTEVSGVYGQRVLSDVFQINQRYERVAGSEPNKFERKKKSQSVYLAQQGERKLVETDEMCLMEDASQYFESSYTHGEDDANFSGRAILESRMNWAPFYGFAFIITPDPSQERPETWNGSFGSVIWSTTRPEWYDTLRAIHKVCSNNVR